MTDVEGAGAGWDLEGLVVSRFLPAGARSSAFAVALAVERMMESEERHSFRGHLEARGLGTMDPTTRSKPSKVMAELRGTVAHGGDSARLAIKQAAEEASQRDKILAIRKSWRSYASQLRAWGGWCQMMKYQPHFVVDREEMRWRVMHWRCVVQHGPSYTQYVAAVKWGARFLSLRTKW